MEVPPIGQNMIIMMITAIIIGSIALIITMSLVEPLLSIVASTTKTANRISLSMGAMSGIEKGRLRMPTEISSTYNVVVSYEEKGEKNGYKIEEKGWYVIVSAKGYEQESVGVSRIYSYPDKDVDALRAHLSRPRAICVEKERGEHPKVTNCRS